MNLTSIFAVAAAAFLTVSATTSTVQIFENQTVALDLASAKPSVVEWKTGTEHDFGEVKAGAMTKFVFRFQNIEKEPIVVQTVRTTCGCTAARWTEDAVLPGETGEVVIEYDSEQRGSFRKKIRVFFDRQRKPEILYVEGEVI